MHTRLLVVSCMAYRDPPPSHPVPSEARSEQFMLLKSKFLKRFDQGKTRENNLLLTWLKVMWVFSTHQANINWFQNGNECSIFFMHWITFIKYLCKFDKELGLMYTIPMGEDEMMKENVGYPLDWIRINTVGMQPNGSSTGLAVKDNTM